MVRQETKLTLQRLPRFICTEATNDRFRRDRVLPQYDGIRLAQLREHHVEWINHGACDSFPADLTRQIQVGSLQSFAGGIALEISGLINHGNVV